MALISPDASGCALSICGTALESGEGVDKPTALCSIHHVITAENSTHYSRGTIANESEALMYMSVWGCERETVFFYCTIFYSMIVGFVRLP